MADYSQIRRLMDACRGNADGQLSAADRADLELASFVESLDRDPATRDQWRRAAQWDVAIQSALVDAPLPAGLAERILQRLAAELTAAELTADERTTLENVLSDDVTKPALARPRWRDVLWSRRRWLAAGMATAAALFLVVTLYWPTDKYSPERVLTAVSEFEATVPPVPGRLVTEQAAPAAFPLSGSIVSSPHTAWIHVTGLLGRRGIAYQLTAPGGKKATLYVVRIASLPNDPQIAAEQFPTAPGRPRLASGGKTMAAWREQGRLYVLVVHGDENAYRQFVRPSAPLA